MPPAGSFTNLPPVPSGPATAPLQIGRIQASWLLAKASLELVWEDKILLLFPFLEAIVVAVFCVFFVGAVFLGYTFSHLELQHLSRFVVWSILFLLYLGTYFISVFFKAGVMSIVRNKLAGDPDVSFGAGLRGAGSRVGALFLWSLIAATVGVVLDILKSQKKNGIVGAAEAMGASVLQTAWNIASNFALPAIVVENVGPIDALKRSVATLKRAWGESIFLYVGTGLFFTLMFILLFIVAFAGVYVLFSVSASMALVWGVLCLIAFVLLKMFASVAGSVFKIVVYEYASVGQNAKGFSPALLALAMGKK